MDPQSLLKVQMDVHVELTAPDPFICALAKIERGHRRDIIDVQSMIRDGLISTTRLWELFCAIEPDLLRYPAITPRVFRSAVEAFCTAHHTP